MPHSFQAVLAFYSEAPQNIQPIDHMSTVVSGKILNLAAETKYVVTTSLMVVIYVSTDQLGLQRALAWFL
jgi:acyl-CoA hydrolase